MSQLPDFVRERAAAGWSLIPCGRNRRPLLTSWKKFQERAAELFELEAWQRDLKAPCWAVVCGHISGVICLDQDGEAGKETGRRLGLVPHVETPSGGWHTYIVHPGHHVKTLNAKAKLELGARYPGLDIRADGGYALIWGKAIDKRDGATARPYLWLREATPPDPLAAVPAEVREFLGLNPPAAHTNGNQRPAAAPPPVSDDTEYWTLQALQRAPSEGRNNAGVWLCRQLRDSAQLSAADARRAMRNYATRCPQTDTKGNHDPYTFAESDATTGSIYSRPRGEPAKNPNRDRYTPRRDGSGAAPQAGGQPAAAPDPSDGPTPPAAGQMEPAAGREPRVFPCTDLGNAERMRARHGQDIRYCHVWKAWLIWDGTAWRPDETGAIMRRAADTVRHIYAEAAEIADSEIRQAYARWSRKSESKSALAALVGLAESLDGIAIRAEDLDRDPYLFNCETGTIDLRTGELRRPARGDYITRTAPTPYDAAAAAPTWERFVSEIMCERAELIEFVRRAAGYSITGDVSEKCLFLCHGGGDNGKTTFLETLKSILGEYAGQVLIDTLMTSRNARGGPDPDIADLKGRRLITSSEVEDGQRLAEGRLKYLTGMSTIKTRGLWEKTWEFDPQYSIWLDCNHLPQIRGTDQAIWERIKRVPFDYTVEAAHRDRRLKEKLLAERAGILAWCVAGCLAWQRDGLAAPEEVTEATKLYRAEMDILGRFIEEAVYTGPPTLATASRQVYRAYTAWAEAVGEHVLSERIFGQRMIERGIARRHERTGNVYVGIGLKTTDQEDAAAPYSPYFDSSVKDVKGNEAKSAISPENMPPEGESTGKPSVTLHTPHTGDESPPKTGPAPARPPKDELIL